MLLAAGALLLPPLGWAGRQLRVPMVTPSLQRIATALAAKSDRRSRCRAGMQIVQSARQGCTAKHSKPQAAASQHN